MTFLLFVLALIFTELLLVLWATLASACSPSSRPSAKNRQPAQTGGPQILSSLFSLMLLTTAFC